MRTRTRIAAYLTGAGLYITLLWADGGLDGWRMARFSAELTGFFTVLAIAALWLAGAFPWQRKG